MKSVRDKRIKANPQTPEGGFNAGCWRLSKLSLIISGIVILCSLFSISASAQDIKLPARPDPPRLVNDLAGMLSGSEADMLEHKLKAYNDSTSTQIAVVTIQTLDGADIAQYATELGAQWGVGTKGKDNGVVLLIAKAEHKIFIATGRGVEANLPDITSKEIIDRLMKPQFKAGHYYEGINAAIDEMMARLSGQFVNDNKGVKNPKDNAKLIALIIVIIFLIIIFINNRNRGQTYGSSAPVFFPWFFPFGGGGGGGFDSGGGGDGGGFGGFGGGDFGGGGAGGDW